jgi:hypothetical protein
MQRKSVPCNHSVCHKVREAVDSVGKGKMMTQRREVRRGRRESKKTESAKMPDAKNWGRKLRTAAIGALFFVCGAPCLAQKRAAISSAQVAEEVRNYRLANEDRIVRELTEFLAIPNVASDTENIQKNAAHLVEMLEARGIETHLLPISGREAHGDFLRALRWTAGGSGGVDRWQTVRAGVAQRCHRGWREAHSASGQTSWRV